MKKLLTKQTITIAAILIFIIALLAIAQVPPFRPAIGIPGAMEEVRLTSLALAQQQHAEIAAQIASETASSATHVFTARAIYSSLYGYLKLKQRWITGRHA